ncbi:MAG TPA: hypothetical protein VE134_07825 [Methanomicrobiales archaeon]|nr:hypothetical protein [Methanomicrobiales archaeon]
MVSLAGYPFGTLPHGDSMSAWKLIFNPDFRAIALFPSPRGEGAA